MAVPPFSIYMARGPLDEFSKPFYEIILPHTEAVKELDSTLLTKRGSGDMLVVPIRQFRQPRYQ